ncbi:cation:proton antiporter [Baaleninema sp.]|uniref:cation:proton antiporter n=1 Tax=Baaleninema sp. TaxID=3101197 RepID=UPI003CFDF196
MEISLLVLSVGVILTLGIFIKALLNNTGIPSLVAFLGFGFILNLLDRQFQILGESGYQVFEFLAEIGIISLLFRVGLESDLAGLKKQLPRASWIWIADISVNGILGFFAAYLLLQQALIPSLFVAIAMTATSVGVSVSVWQNQNATDSPTGELLLDVAELDDISGAILMALLLALAPTINQSGADSSLWNLAATTSGSFFLKALVFGTLCFLFSQYIEENLTAFFRRIEPTPSPMLEVIGIGFIIASIAGLLGFSIAIGAFFAGLVFSRDPESVKIDASFNSIYEMFTPFFFIGIGLKIEPSALTTGLGWGAMLFAVAVVGKLLGAGLPALLKTHWKGATLIGISMIPRAEISTIIMQKGLALGSWAVSDRLFAAMVVVSALTTTIVPTFLSSLLKKWHPVLRTSTIPPNHPPNPPLKGGRRGDRG